MFLHLGAFSGADISDTHSKVSLILIGVPSGPLADRAHQTFTETSACGHLASTSTSAAVRATAFSSGTGSLSKDAQGCKHGPTWMTGQ